MTRPSRHLVDPQLFPALDLLPDLHLTDATLSRLRTDLTALVPPLDSFACEDVQFETRAIATSAGKSVELQIFRPLSKSSAPIPAMLHIHGGGYVVGTATQAAPGNIRTVREVGCLVASVEYDLAPEAQGTQAVKQCYAALQWLSDNARELGIDARRIAVGGESAGGGLAAALALYARDQGGVQPCFQLLIYPMIDDRTGRDKDGNPYTGEFIWNRSANQFGWRALLGTNDPALDVGYIVPARAPDLAGLPPAYLSVGALDLFVEENLEYARRLMRAGVPLELHVYPGAFHGFELAAEADVSKRAEAERRAALARAFAAQGAP